MQHPLLPQPPAALPIAAGGRGGRLGGELLGGESLGAVVLADGLEDGLFFLGLNDGDGVRKGLLRTGLALGVGSTHDLDLDTENTLAEEDVAGSAVNEFFGGLTGVDHETVLFMNILAAVQYPPPLYSIPNF